MFSIIDKMLVKNFDTFTFSESSTKNVLVSLAHIARFTDNQYFRSNKNLYKFHNHKMIKLYCTRCYGFNFLFSELSAQQKIRQYSKKLDDLFLFYYRPSANQIFSDYNLLITF